MPAIPFIEARFFDPGEGRFELENRLRRHLRMLRCKKPPPSVLMPLDDALDDIDSFDPHLMGIIDITSDDDARIERRVKRLQDRRKAASGLEHLRSDDRTRLEGLKDGGLPPEKWSSLK